MIGAPKDESRRLIPRWRPLSKTAASGELAQPLLSSGRLATGATAHTPAKRELRTLTSDFAAKLLTWRHDRSIATASELVSAGLVLGVEDEVFHAADFILGLKNNPFPWVTSIADCVRSVNAEPPTGAGLTVLPIDGGTAPTTPDHRRMLETIEISEQRRRLYVYPRNAIAWLQMALSYSNLGQIQQAQRAFSRALSLAPANRYVLRSGARLLVHLLRPDDANELLRRNKRTPHDPWLLATEIATSSLAGRTSQMTKRASALLDDKRLPPRQTAELAGALATLELEHGNRNRARRLFRASLIDPTENAVAQAEWVRRHYHDDVLRDKSSLLSLSREAQCLEAIKDGRWHDAVAQAKVWLDDEPFSKAPPLHGSCVALVMNEPISSEQFSRIGLLANSTDTMLLNNLAVSLAHQGCVVEARIAFSNIRASNPLEHVIFTATDGLIHFRMGNFDAARRLYQRAVTLAEDNRLDEQRARAMVYYLLEEINHDPGLAASMLPLAEEACKNTASAEIRRKLAELHTAVVSE